MTLALATIAFSLGFGFGCLFALHKGTVDPRDDEPDDISGPPVTGEVVVYDFTKRRAA